MSATSTTAAPIARRRSTRPWRRVGFAGLVVLVLLPAAFVFFWMVTSSLKRGVDIYAIPPKWFGFDVTFGNYETAFERTPFARYAMNSLVVATASSMLGLVLGLPAAYTIARYNQKRLAVSLLTARLLPGIAYIVPFFLVFTQLRMVGTYPALVLAHLVVTFPLTVFIMINFFEGLPAELFDAAQVDGCTRIGTFFRIALPLTKPGMVTSAVLAFIFSWNDFKMALVLSNSETRTLPVAVYNFVHEASLEWGPMMAYATIISIPVILLTAFVQKHIVTGMTMGSIK